jgi:hypothetical protein
MGTRLVLPLLGALASVTGGGLAAAAPSGPAPASGAAGIGPPPAWIETEGGDHWLAPSWDSWCGEPGEGLPAGAPPGRRACVIVSSSVVPRTHCNAFIPRSPEIRLRPGETVRFHLGLAPSALALAVRGGTFALAASDTAEWTVQGPTGGAILAPTTGRGDVTYRARFAMTTDVAPPALRALALSRVGDRTTLKLALSEPATLVGCLAPLGAGPRAPARPLPLPRGQTVPAGERRIALGALPAGRYRLTLLARDRGGNSTLVERTLSVAST